ncbi:MAG: TrkA family potassium uptake protein [Anaerolineae bacterium]|nr:TrkA family potassium uptake protein [Anaerolineae bacterium]
MNVIIVGGGHVGAHLAALLLSQGHQIKVIELHPHDNATASHHLPAEIWLYGNGADPDILESAGIYKADVVAAVTGADETNLVITSLARFEFGVPRVVARVNHPGNAWLFTAQMGVDVAVNQADLMAHLIAEQMSLGDMMTLLKLRKGQYSLVEEKVHPTSLAADRAICDVDWPAECVLSAIIRQGQLIIPRGNVVIKPADEVLAVVHSAQVARLAALLGKTRETDGT